MAALTRLKRAEDAGWKIVCSRAHLVRHLVGQGQQDLRDLDCRWFHGPNCGRLDHSRISYISPKYRYGDNLQQVGSAFGSQLSVGWRLLIGPFFLLSRGLATKRSIAIQRDSEDDDDEGNDLSDIKMEGGDISEVDFSDDENLSDCESVNKDVKKTKRNLRTSPQQTTASQFDEDLDSQEEYSDAELHTSSPWDVDFPTRKEGIGDRKRPLWMRLNEASASKSATLQNVLDEWTAEGNPICRAVIVYSITVLRKQRKFWRALELSDWVMTEKPFELIDMDYGIRIELIAKVQGTQRAAAYFATIPKELQTSMVYSILLKAYVEQNREKEATSLIEKAERLGLSHKTYMYNQLLYLYKKNGLMTGVAEVLQTMDQKNIQPDVHTYNIILDVRARKGDADGMDKVLAQLQEDENVEPDAATFAILAKGYIQAGLHAKAAEVVKKIEESPFRRRRIVNLLLLKLYGQIGNEEELERIWGLVNRGSKVLTSDYVAMIRALGKVGNSARAEDVFEEMEERLDKLTVHHYNALLSVYASLGRTQKGESLLKQLARAHVTPNSATFHELVQMYLKARQEEKAMEVLAKAQKASQSSIRRRPQYVTFQAVLEWFAQNGDVKNAEKVVRDLKQAGYLCSYRSYVTLLKAYENGRMSPYGLLDRLRADNIVPNQFIRTELRKLDGT